MSGCPRLNRLILLKICSTLFLTVNGFDCFTLNHMIRIGVCKDITLFFTEIIIWMITTKHHISISLYYLICIDYIFWILFSYWITMSVFLFVSYNPMVMLTVYMMSHVSQILISWWKEDITDLSDCLK